MRIRLHRLLLLFSLVTGTACANDLLFQNVNIVDIDSGTIIGDQSVLLSDGYISEVSTRKSVQVPVGTRVIDASDRYLMPALWDMHTHPTEPDALSMFVANGVGGIRIMWGLPRHLEWRARVELGDLLGPRLLVAGPIIEGVPPPDLASVVDTEGRRLVSTHAEGVAEVRRQKAAGFDYIKVYNNIPLDAYEGLAAEAHRLHIPVVGHVPFAVGLDGVLAARQKSIEHLRGYIEMLVPEDAPVQPGIDFRSRALAWEYVDESRMPELARATRAAGAWQCPTLGTSLYHAPSKTIERYLATPEAEYLDPATRAGLRHRQQVKWLSNFSEADFARATRASDKQATLLRAMHAEGVQLLAGTDANTFGFSLHRELEAFVEAGLSPREALQTATLNPALFAGLENEVGRVAVGYAADLVLLDANPLQDIRNTSKINSVILRGQLLDRAALDDMLKKVKARYTD
jgi:hypothetical protein